MGSFVLGSGKDSASSTKDASTDHATTDQPKSATRTIRCHEKQDAVKQPGLSAAFCARVAMWLLENSGGAFQGRRLWLRPGKRYLFGRTRAEPGQLVVSDKTISRKHLTISVDRVREGGGRDCSARSVVTIEDLNTKIGTVVNGTQIRGQKFVLIQDRNEVKMGHMADLFRITWFPVVFSFSFTSKELRADPWARLRDDLEQLDVKYLADYDLARTTHVVAKKRNTSKGLQALINGKHIVAESFITALVQVASSASAETASPLEENFDASWPDALSHLPPRGDEPSDRPVSTYAPDARRRDIFDGYTFVFYDEKQYENLLGPISNARGKALLGKVVPSVTEVDDFVRYIKGVAGETGLGEFEDGSVGKGVVVVRYLPAKGDYVDWFARFTTAVALRLDHRLIDQREFLDAILAVDPSMLRRPLEVEQYQPPPQPVDAMAVDEPTATDPPAETAASQPAVAPSSLSQASSTRRARARRGLTSRFKGFDEDLDVGDDSGLFSSTAIAPAAAVPVSAVPAYDDEDEKMFVSQTRGDEELEQHERNPRKRGTPAPAEDRNGNDMDDIAPTAAAVKRQRIEAGVDPVPPRAALPDSDEENENSDDSKENVRDSKINGRASGLKRGKGKGTSDTILEQARKNREAAEKREAEERAELEQIPDDGVDADEIRKLTLVEEIAVVRRPRGSEAAAAAAGTRRELDLAEGRWDPKWNGRRNYKRFRKQGDPVGRPPPRVIVRLEPAKTKEYGLGDDYWLEGGEDAPRPQHRDGPSTLNNSTASSSIRVPSTIALTPSASTVGRSPEVRLEHAVSSARTARGRRVTEDANMSDAEVIPDTEPEDNNSGGVDIGTEHADSPSHEAVSGRIPETGPQPEPEPDLPRTRAGKAATRAAVARQSQASQASQVRAQRTRSGAQATRGHDTQEADTQASSDVVFHTPLSTATVAPLAASAAAGKRAAPVTVASRAPPPKRPRRVGGLGGSSMGSTPGTITLRNSSDDDDDDDDGLKFKFRSRR